MKFMSWTLHKPQNFEFEKFAKVNGEWYSKDYTIIDPEAPQKWSNISRKTFFQMIQKYPDKMYSIGLHEFGVDYMGRVRNTATFALDYKKGTNPDYPNLENSYDPKNYVLGSNGEIKRPCAQSLCYLMHTYPEIKWCLQFLCTGNDEEIKKYGPQADRVRRVIENIDNAQDTFVRECHDVTAKYLELGFPVRGIEIDFEYTWRLKDGEPFDLHRQRAEKYRDLLSRIKNECCIPLGMELRINMFAMTGKFEPDWYGWHDYETLASAKDKNGNQAVDEFQMMSYDFSWGGSAPGPSTPLWWLEKILKHVNNVLPPHKTFIGNAGYGRRWPLGENVYGTTLDYKGLMLAQNGIFVHNEGNTDRKDIYDKDEYFDVDGKKITRAMNKSDIEVYSEEKSNEYFTFFDQDFIPICGINDPASDYQITYFHTYDRFKMTQNGGASFKYMNWTNGGDYVTKYSKEQNAIFTGVHKIITDVSETYGIVDEVGSYVIENDKITGIPIGTTFKGYSIAKKEKTVAFEVTNEEEPRMITYNFDFTGTKRLIAVVAFPFFDQSDFYIEVNGVSKEISAGDEWYPLLQKRHFYDLGTVSFSGNNTITMGENKGEQLYGFVICDDFNHNMIGGYVDVPACVYPMKKRGKIDTNTGGTEEIVEAQYPEKMRVVGEILRRPPRPAIIWEDMFGSYKEEGVDCIGDITSIYKYYVPAAAKGFSKGEWNVYPEPEEDYAHALGDGTNGYSQIVLNNKFEKNILIDIEAASVDENPNLLYGVRIGAQSEGNSSTGYLVLLDFKRKVVSLYNNTDADSDRILAWPMPEINMTARNRLRVYIYKGRLNCYIGDYSAFQYQLSESATKGACGIYVNKGKLKLYKYNISSLERYERMERTKIIADGVEYVKGEVPRTCAVDEFGFLMFSGYPQETGLSPNIIDTQVDRKYEWDTDYKNLKLAEIPSWKGTKKITLNSIDAGIWIKNIYIGDDEGMSVAYNSDRVGFIKTVNMINDYNCKGVAMWTLGQEDPSSFNYLP